MMEEDLILTGKKQVISAIMDLTSGRFLKCRDLIQVEDHKIEKIIFNRTRKTRPRIRSSAMHEYDSAHSIE